MQRFRLKEFKRAMFLLSKNEVLKEVPLKTIHFFLNNLLVEKTFTVGTKLEPKGIYFIVKGCVEYMKEEELFDKKMSFRIAKFVEGDSFRFPINQGFATAISNPTKTFWLSNEKLDLLELIDNATFIKLTHFLNEKDTLHQKKAQIFKENYLKWLKSEKENEAKQKYMIRRKSERKIMSCRTLTTFLTIPSLRNLPSSIDLKDEATENETYEGDSKEAGSIESLSSRKELFEIDLKNKKEAKCQEIKEKFIANRKKAKSQSTDLLTTLKTQMRKYPLSIPNASQSNFRRTMSKIIETKIKNHKLNK